jgi:hypothetical protein
MTTYTWTVTKLYTLQQPDPNYVVNAYWRLTGVDGQYTAYIESNNQFDSQQESNFIPYDQLTNDIVIGWVQNQLGAGGISSWEACVQGQIDSMINPPPVPQNTPLPWSA